MYKKTLSLLGVALALSAFASQAESERQASRERRTCGCTRIVRLKL